MPIEMGCTQLPTSYVEKYFTEIICNISGLAEMVR